MKKKGSDLGLDRLKHFFSFLLIGVLIFVPPISLKGQPQTLYRISMPVLIFLSFILARKSVRMENYAEVLLAFFTASIVSLFDYLLYLNQSTLSWLSTSRMELTVYFKIISAVIVVIPIILFTKATGKDLASLYLKTGKLRLGLTVGLLSFIFFAATSIPVANTLYGGHGLDYGKLVFWGPWILMFIFSNAVKEELQFRGLFLNRFKPLLGARSSNLLQALIFTLPHLGELYSTSLPIFLVIVFLLGLGFGVSIQKTDSLLTSILIHAGADIPVILGIFSNM